MTDNGSLDNGQIGNDDHKKIRFPFPDCSKGSR